MIENIYNNTHDNGQNGRNNTLLFKMPKNIRQIGPGDQKRKIYAEDYVMTYIKQLSMKAATEYCYAVLLGQFITIENCRNIFISGAVEITEFSMDENNIFSNETWTGIYENIKKYFSDVEIVGWSVIRTGLPLTPSDRMKKTHIDNFGGQGKTLLMYDSLEREEIFYVYEENGLKEQDGYYIYYEKNEEMQNYMVSQKDSPSEEAEYEDKATKEIRRVIAEKKGDKSSRKYTPKGILYAAGTLTAAVVLVMGSAVLVNNSRMRGMEETLDVISHSLSEKISAEDQAEKENQASKDKQEEKDKTTRVETIKGNITTIKGETFVEEKEKQENQEKDNNVDVNQDKEEQDQKKPDAKDNKAADNNKESEDDKKEEDNSKETNAGIQPDYIVEKGDTLASISMKVYGNTGKIDEIQQLNGIEDQNKILVGQKLAMPE